MKMKIVILALALLLLLPVQASARNYCLNSSWMREYLIIDDDNTKTIDEFCPYGCDEGRGLCTDYSGPPGTAIPLTLFLSVELVAVILLGWAFLGAELLQKLISALMAAILLFPLALMSTNVMVGNVAMMFIWLAWLNFALAFIAVIMVIYAMILFFKEDLT